MRKIFLLLVLLFSLSLVRAQTFVVDTLIYNGNPSNRINLLILGDGYTSSQMGQFRTNALSVGNYLLSTPPFNLYANFFNVFGIEVISNQSGIDHSGVSSDGCGSQPVASVDNYLQSGFDGGSPGGGGVHRCIYSNQSSLIYSIANTNFPQYDYINVLANTTYYGGCAGGIAYTSINSSSSEVFVHELGHMFGGLADEYDYGSTSCNPGTTQNINASQQTDTSLLVWKKWLTTAPIPTPAGTNCSLIGLYEGSKYCATNWYRPKCNCKMRSLNQPFCEVCKEQLIYKISTLVNYIESYSPTNLNPPICRNVSQLFSVNVLNSSNNTVRVQWFVDNVLVSNNSTSFLFNPSSYANGYHRVKAVAYDTTQLSKKAMTPYEVVWNVNLNSQLSATTSQTDASCNGSDGTATVNPSGGTVNYYFPLSTETWEGSNTWTLVNGTQANKWYVGTSTSNGGLKSIYVSNNSSANAYTTTSTSIVHFYKNFTFPANAVNIKIRFDWKGMGEAGNDFFTVHVVPTSTTPIAGTALSTGQVGSNYSLGSTFATETISGLDANAGTTRRLVFTWRNNASSGTQPPAAIDNIIISYETAGSYTYAWNTNPVQPVAMATGLSAGNYVATVTDVSGCSFSTPPVSITAAPCSVDLRLKVFIEGLYQVTGQMRAAVNPTSYPALCDTIRVRLRFPYSPYENAFTITGTIDVNGNGSFLLPLSVFGNSYYIAVRHRNSLETWSASPVLLNSSIVNYDFTNALNKAYGNNLLHLGNGKYGIFSGDVDRNGSIDSQDILLIKNKIISYTSGYLDEDLSGDFLVESADFSIVEKNNGKLLLRP